MRLIQIFALFLLLVGCASGEEQTLATSVARPTATAVPVELTCNETTGEVVDMEVEDPATGTPVAVGVYLPPCYAVFTDQHYPVIYLLPGGGGGRHEWPQWGVYAAAETLLQAGEIRPFIIVTPETSLDVPHLEAVIAEMMVPAIDTQFRTIARRDHRFVGGVSFGGALSWQLTVQNPDVFGGAGLFGAAGLHGRWQDVAPALLAAIPTAQTPFFYFDVGRDDPFLAAAADYQALLTANGLTYTHVSRGGGHEVDYWQQSIPEYLRWFDAVVGQRAYRLQKAVSEQAGADTTVACQEPSGAIDRSLTLPDPATPRLTQPVVVYLPPCYQADPSRRYPVLYFLHGYGGSAGALSPSSWIHFLRRVMYRLSLW